MTVRYINETNTIITLTDVTNVQPVSNGVQLLLEHATPKIINVNKLISVKP